MIENYVCAKTVAETVELLSTSKGKARIIAGGTDLLIELQSGRHTAEVLIDLNQIEELKNIEETSDGIRIGASITHAQAAKSPLVQKHAIALSQACRKVGSLQIRNSATVVGNVVSGNPAADAAVALVALDATADVTTLEGTQNMPVSEMYAGICQSCIDSCCQVVTHLNLPLLQPGEGTAYLRMEQRKALSLPMLAVGAKVRLTGDAFDSVNLIVAPVGAGPQHASDAEEFLKGAPVNEKSLEETGRLACNQAKFRSSAIRGSKEYRTGVLPVFVERVLQAAIDDARSRA